MTNDTRLALCDVRGPLHDLNVKLSGEEGGAWLEALNKFLRKENPWKEFPAFRFDKRKDGWELLEGADEPVPEGDVVPPLEAVPFLREGEDHIGGEELVRRDREEYHCNRGQRYAEWLLEHQDQIPEEFRNYYLVFTKTKWRGPDGDCRVACLNWNGKRWYLDFGWLGHVFDVSGRLVRTREGA